MCNQTQGRNIFIVTHSESPKLEIIQKSSHNRVYKSFVVYLDNGKLFSNEKSQTVKQTVTTMCLNLINIILLSKELDTKEYMSYDSIYIKFKKFVNII